MDAGKLIDRELWRASSRRLLALAAGALLPAVVGFGFMLLFAPLGEAWAGIEDSVERYREILSEEDPDDQVSKAGDALAAAGCNVNNALSAILQGDNGAMVERMGEAADKYDAGAEVLEGLVRQGRFQRALSESVRSFVHLTGLFAESPTKQADLLQRIAELAREAEKATRRIANGEGNEADLTLVVQSSADITRLIALFFQVALVA